MTVPTETPAFQTLLDESRERYSPGQGPWSKDPGTLDQVDLVFLESFAESFRFYSDTRGLMGACIKSLVDEVRKARKWPEPTREGEG